MAESLHATTDILGSGIGNAPISTSADLDIFPDGALCEKYRQSYFKAQVNALFKRFGKSQYRKDLPDWSSIEKRLRHAGTSINTITALRDGFHDGWRTWDGCAFLELPDPLQSSGRKDQTNPESTSPGPTPIISQKSAVVARAQPRDKKPFAKISKPRSRRSVEDEGYDSYEGERTAAKSVS